MLWSSIALPACKQSTITGILCRVRARTSSTNNNTLQNSSWVGSILSECLSRRHSSQSYFLPPPFPHGNSSAPGRIFAERRSISREASIPAKVCTSAWSEILYTGLAPHCIPQGFVLCIIIRMTNLQMIMKRIILDHECKFWYCVV